MIGIHIHKNKNNSISSNIKKYYNKLGINCCQIFIKHPLYGHTYKDLDEDLNSFNLPDDFEIFVHSPYIYLFSMKLCSPFSSLLHKEGEKEKVFDNINEQLFLCKKYGFKGLVVHLGKIDEECIIKHLTINIIYDSILYLEMTAHSPSLQNTSVPFSSQREEKGIEEPLTLAQFHNKCFKHSNKIGCCIDTAHLWAAGIDLQNNAEQWINTFYNNINKNIPLLLHLNDNEFDLGSGKDKHAIIGEGKIWKKNKRGAELFITWAISNDIPIILERNNDFELKPLIAELDYINNNV